jgi:hypothetical protein
MEGCSKNGPGVNDIISRRGEYIYIYSYNMEVKFGWRCHWNTVKLNVNC